MAMHLQFHHCVSSSLSPNLPYLQHPNLSWRFPVHFPGKVRVLTFRKKFRGRNGVHYSVCCFRKTGSEIEQVSVDDNERPPFDINLAVILAGFAFEAYTSPPEDVGRFEVDAAGCKTVYLSEEGCGSFYSGGGIGLGSMTPVFGT
uniref:Uncharacterized protein n=1 Tax=Fagus sylvatica TaxID=28930 RepID=A0A2N9EM08_FAGSY